MREGYYMKKTLLISCMLLATTGAFANDAFTPINLSSAATTTKTTTAVTGEETLMEISKMQFYKLITHKLILETNY